MKRKKVKGSLKRIKERLKSENENTLGQKCVLQSLICSLFPSHTAPPWSGCWHSRMRRSCPPPHVTLHALHGCQELHSPSTRRKKKRQVGSEREGKGRHAAFMRSLVWAIEEKSNYNHPAFQNTERHTDIE